MKIVFDNLIFNLQSRGGGSVYWWELTNRICKKVDERVLLLSRQNKNIINGVYPSNTQLVKLNNPVKITRFWPPFYILNVPHIFHSSYYRYSKNKNAINIVTVHDFTHEHFEKGIRLFLHHAIKKRAIENASRIICVSESTKKDLIRYFPQINNNLIKVIYNGVSDEYGIISNENTQLKIENLISVKKNEYVLYVGHRTKYKNFSAAVESIKINKRYTLVIVGSKLSKAEERYLKKMIPDKYIVLSGVSNEILNMLYNNAQCLIYPSSYEGFGIPVIEAMKAGCPVICSNNSSLPEVGGTAAIILNEVSGENISKAIDSLNAIDFRKTIIRKGLNWACEFSWEKCACETLKVYEEAYMEMTR